MSTSVGKRHHVVNKPVRPDRTPAGDAFTEFVLAVAWLGGIVTTTGEALAKRSGQTLARWVILDAIEEKPSTVAQIARRRGIARQAVQRVADLLERDGLAVYESNPEHRRARLLRPTPRGQEALRTISIAQKRWADALGAEFGETKLRNATTMIDRIRQVVMAHGLPDEPGDS